MRSNRISVAPVVQGTTSSSDGSQNQFEDSSSLSNYQTDEWFQSAFEILYRQVMYFVDTFFCQYNDIDSESDLYPWVEMSSEFVRYSMMVADPDDNLGDWNRILLRRNERRYLLVGILARVLEAKVFGELLFGVNEAQKKQLEDLETSFDEVEGKLDTAVRCLVLSGK
jgi:hypothetical protein